MTDEERRLIAGFVERVAGANRQGPQPASAWKVGQAAPGPDQQPLPPVDPEADRLLAELFTRHPEARYRLTQTAFVQEHALAETQNRIQRLEYELERTRREAQAAQSQPKGILGGLFGGGGQPAPQPMPPPPQPVHAPGYQPGMFGQQQQGRGGMGFLGTAGAAVAGVAGGMLAANAISGLMGGGGHGAAHAAESPAESPAASPLPGPEGTSGWGQAPQQDDGAGWGDEER